MHVPLFWAGARLSSWIMLALFANLSLYRRRWRPLFAAFVWLAGFEAAWQTTVYLTHGYAGPSWGFAPRSAVILAVGALAIYVAARRGVKTNPILMAAAAAVWIVWLATGFHSNNHTLVRIDVTSEVLNEAAKTLWALAYFVPLLKRPRKLPWLMRGEGRLPSAACGRRLTGFVTPEQRRRTSPRAPSSRATGRRRADSGSTDWLFRSQRRQQAGSGRCR